MMIAFDLYPHKCHVCGKKFEAGSDWVYKDGYKRKKYKWFCSYHCSREYERKEAKKNGKRNYRSA